MNNKKKIVFGVLALTVVFGLTACGSTSSPVMDKAQAEAAFIGDASAQGNPIVNSMTRDDVLTIGYYACEQLKSVSLQELAQRVALNDTPELRDATYVVIASAVLHLCPQYKDQAGLNA